jgi:hypothetical protein
MRCHSTNVLHANRSAFVDREVASHVEAWERGGSTIMLDVIGKSFGL